MGRSELTLAELGAVAAKLRDVRCECGHGDKQHPNYLVWVWKKDLTPTGEWTQPCGEARCECKDWKPVWDDPT